MRGRGPVEKPLGTNQVTVDSDEDLELRASCVFVDRGRRAKDNELRDEGGGCLDGLSLRGPNRHVKEGEGCQRRLLVHERLSDTLCSGHRVSNGQPKSHKTSQQ